MPLSPQYPVIFDGTAGKPSLLSADGTSYRGSYATVADVQLFFVNSDISSKVLTNQTTLATLLCDVTQDIDRVIETMYVVPITANVPTHTTATNAIQYLNFITKHMAAAKVHELIVGADGYTEAHAAQAITHHETASQRIDDITRGVTQLFDALPQAGGEKPAFPAGIAAEYNPEYVYPDYIQDPETVAPLFGVRNDPPFDDKQWVP